MPLVALSSDAVGKTLVLYPFLHDGQPQGRRPSVTHPADATGPSPFRSLRWLALFVGAVALALLVPFLVAAPTVDAWFAEFETHAGATGVVALIVVALLTVDIIAPVPSSLVAAFAGVTFGAALGTLVVFCGLSLGCLLGYSTARFARTRLDGAASGRRALAAAAAIHSRHGVVGLVVARPVPLLAEATVVVAGLTGMRRSTFAMTCLVANAGVAIIFAAVPAAMS